VTPAARAGGADTEGSTGIAGLDEVEKKARERPGFRLFTVLAWDDERGALHRVYSSAPSAYPVAGEKVMPRDAPWIVQVVVRRRPYLGIDPAAVAAVFSDHALIKSLGCGAVVNLPVVDGDRTLGVLNLLDSEGAYDAGSVAAALPLAQLAVPALLSWHASYRTPTGAASPSASPPNPRS
jgi:hypothetical protein